MASGAPASPHRQKAPLAPAGGSLPQLILATLPLLLVLLYFLILAARRPEMDIYTRDDDAYLDEAFENGGPILVGLMDMLYIFLSVFVLWSCLAVYLLIFVPRRHALIESYATSSTVVLGNVHYRPKSSWSKLVACGCFRPETAVVTYAHPDPETVNRERGTVYDDDGPARRKDWIVRRVVKTYRPYSRENVPIVLLSKLPLSGIPRDDVEVDVASFRMSEDYKHDRRRDVCRWVIFPWLAFTIFSSMFVITRMSRIYDPIDDPSRGWKAFLLFVFGVTPLLALGGNYLRWTQYKNYKSNSGKVLEGDRNRALPFPEEEELKTEDGGMNWSNVFGAPSDEELGIKDEEGSYRNFT